MFFLLLLVTGSTWPRDGAIDWRATTRRILRVSTLHCDRAKTNVAVDNESSADCTLYNDATRPKPMIYGNVRLPR